MARQEPLSDITTVAEMFSVDDYMYFYRDYLTPERSEAEVEAARELLKMYPPMRVLDLACGFGRIANRFAARGFRVTGIEYLPGFLDLARQEAAAMKVEVDYRQGDMRLLDEVAVFDRVLMMFNSFGYFTDAENLQVMQNVARALKPGGRVGFDVGHRDGVLNNFHPHYVSEKDDSLMINRFSFDVWSGRLSNDRIIIRDGVRKDRPFSIRLYSLTEMHHLLEQAGLALEAAYGEWDGQALEMDSPAMVIIARKPV